MGADDYAILIGINRYPELGQGGSNADLQGPCNDADAVKAWLMDPRGGAIPLETNIRVIKSVPAASAADARPTAEELEAALADLDAIALANQRAGRGLRVGRRLYLFMSGHGFSPAPRQGCLFTANARERMTYNVHATGWLAWLQDSGYFRELVLWLDCCMDRMSFLGPRNPPLPPVNASEPLGAGFIAFAAQRNRRAIEVPIVEDGGKYHGVFTWTLLEGLRGAAADANGRVTGRSLADWIRNGQAARIAPHDLEDVDVSKEPEVIQEDAGLIFARGVSRPLYRVRISFPPTIGPGTARLWSGAPPTIAREIHVTAIPETLLLQPGLYLIDVPHAGLRQGFEVVSSMDISIDEQGPPVAMAPEGSVFQLVIDPQDPSAEVFVIDGRFSLVDGNPARLSTPLPFGLFKVKTRIGRGVRERVILLDRDRPPISPAEIVQPMATVLPISGTAATHEYHEAGQAAAMNAVRNLRVEGGRAAIMVMARAFSSREAPISGTRPWEGVSIVDSAGQIVLDLERDGTRYPGDSQSARANEDPYATCVKAVEPGSYFLRQRLDDGATAEQSLIVCKGWVHEVYVLRRAGPGDSSARLRPRVSFMMRRPGGEAPAGLEDRLIETARVALADERRILSEELEMLLLMKFENPMAGIIGGHLLLIERERDIGRNVSALDPVVRNLQRLLGAEHPDVTALALQCADARLRRTTSLAGPPMFQRSWRLLAQASQDIPHLIPKEMWERVQALSALPPFLAWATDEAAKSAAREALFREIYGEPASARRHGAFETAKALSAPAPTSAQEESPGIGAALRAWAPPVSKAELSRVAKLNIPPSALETLQAGSV